MAKHEVEIRAVTPADARALAEIQVESYRRAYADLLPQDYLAGFSLSEQERDWGQWLAGQPGDGLWVATDGSGWPVGYALLDFSSADFKDFEAELVALHVLEAHQLRGIGSRLLVKAGSILKNKGVGSLYLWILQGNPAADFYRRLGAESIGEQPWGGNEHYGTDVMELGYGWRDIDRLLQYLNE